MASHWGTGSQDVQFVKLVEKFNLRGLLEESENICKEILSRASLCVTCSWLIERGIFMSCFTNHSRVFIWSASTTNTSILLLKSKKMANSTVTRLNNASRYHHS